MKISNLRKKCLTLKSVIKCMFLSLAMLTIALFFQIAQTVVSSNLQPFQKFMYFLAMWAFLALLIWIVGFSAPELMEIVQDMLGLKEKKE